jgi:uncharacterized protein (TIGR00251 family)
MALTPTDDLPCLRADGEGCVLQVQVVPNAGRTACAGFHDGALRVRLQAQPIEGRANAALLQWLAQSLGLPKRGVTLVSGDTARRKRVHIDCPFVTVATWLRAQLSATRPPGA